MPNYKISFKTYNTTPLYIRTENINIEANDKLHAEYIIREKYPNVSCVVFVEDSIGKTLLLHQAKNKPKSQYHTTK